MYVFVNNSPESGHRPETNALMLYDVLDMKSNLIDIQKVPLILMSA